MPNDDLPTGASPMSDSDLAPLAAIGLTHDMGRARIPVSEARFGSRRYKVAELEGALLDEAVAGLENRDTGFDGHGYYRPSSEWQHGGPIIERERIVLVPSDNTADDRIVWSASVGVRPHYIDDSLPFSAQTMGASDPCATGETPLIAAMRAFVASKLGEEIEL